MKQAEVKVGEVYFAKVSGKLSRVKITEECRPRYSYSNTSARHGGWSAVTIDTHRTIHIRSAAHLRKQAMQEHYHVTAIGPLGSTVYDGELPRASVVIAVHTHFGVGTWASLLPQMNKPEGLMFVTKNQVTITIHRTKVPVTD